MHALFDGGAQRHVQQSHGEVASHIEGGNLFTNAVFIFIFVNDHDLEHIHSDDVFLEWVVWMLAVLHYPEFFACVLAFEVHGIGFDETVSFRHERQLESLVKYVQVAIWVAAHNVHLFHIWVLVVLVQIVEEIQGCLHRDAIVPETALRDNTLSLAVFLLVHRNCKFFLFMLKLLGPSISFIRDVLSVVAEEIVLIDHIDVTVCDLFELSICRLLDLKYLGLELVEVGESEESIDGILVNLLVLLEVICKVAVEGLDGWLCEVLEQLGVDDLLEDLHVLLEDGAVLQLVLLLLVEHVHVFGEERNTSLVKLGARNKLADCVEDRQVVGGNWAGVHVVLSFKKI